MVTVTERPRPEATTPTPSGPGAPVSRPDRTTPRLAVATLGLASATAAGGVALAPAYAEPSLLVTLLSCGAVGSVAATLAIRRRLSAFATVLVNVPIATLLVFLCAVWRPGEGEGVLRAFGEALAYSGARILTSTAPTPVTVDTLALPVLATWLAGVATALAWSSGRHTLALVPGLLLLVASVVLNGPVSPPGYPAIGLLATAAVVLMSSAARDPATRPGSADGATLAIEVVTPGARGRERRRSLLAGSTVVLTAALTVLAGPPLLAGWNAEPEDPREAMTPPLDPQATVNPLGYLPAWAAEPEETLLTVTASEQVTLRWVALSEFTGTTWLTGEGYRVADSTLPEAVPPPPHAATRSATVEPTNTLPGPWVPVVGAPRTVELPSPGYDAESGTVVNMDGSVSGTNYRVTGDVADWRGDELADTPTPVGDVFSAYRELPRGAPDVLDEVVDSVVDDDARPYEQAHALAAYVRDNHTFDPQTPGGHGYPSVEAVLAPPGEDGGGGTSEQFASAFAMLARAADLPSRVVVGFGPGEDQGNGQYLVRTGDAVAWGEIYFDGVGWVPFSVTPGTEESDDSGAAEENTTESGAANDDEDEDDDQHDVGGPARSPDDGSWLVPVLLALAVAVPVLAATLVPAARLLRRGRRLRARAPESRVLGAWWELRDDLRMCAAPPPSGHTVTAVIETARGLLPADSVDLGQDLERLGEAVNRIGFGAGAVVDAGVAARVVEGTRRRSRALRSGRGRARRLTWWLDPRPLFWRTP